MREILPRATALIALGMALYIVVVGVNPYLIGFMIGMMVVILMRVIDLELEMREMREEERKMREMIQEG